MRVLFDTDVVLDLLLDRAPFAQDAVQHACAEAGGLDAVVTRNLEDYKNAALPVFSPDDLLRHLQTTSP